jgi:TM2 domain-containing membrane protein YozV
MDPLLLTQGMTDNQRLLFMSEYNRRRKDRTGALLLTLFLGAFGAHRFYLGQVGLGVLYLVFCWVFWLVAIGELFLIRGRVDNYNQRLAEDIAGTVKALTSSPSTPASV